MRDLKCKVGAGNVVAAVVAVLEKQSSNDTNDAKKCSKFFDVNRGHYQKSFQTTASKSCLIESIKTHHETSTQSTSINSDHGCLENSIFGVYGNVSKADENFRSAVEDFDSVAEDVQRNFSKTNSLRRRKEEVVQDFEPPSIAFKIERAHSLKTIKTNPYFNTQDHTRSLGRKQKILNPIKTTNPSSFLQEERAPHSPHSVKGHGTILKPMPAVPSKPITSEQQCNLTSREFNSAINIDRCAVAVDEDVDRGAYHLKHERDSYKRLSGTDSSASESLTSSGSAEDSSDYDDDSDTEREYVIAKGLETIAEEERVTPSSIRSSRKDLDENESSSTDEPIRGETLEWCDKGSTAGSTSDLSSTNSLEGRKSLRGSSTRCNSDFQWIAKDNPPCELEPSKMDEQVIAPPSTKPPISRNSTREKMTRRDKAPGSLDRRRIHHAQNRQERDQKSRSSHVNSPPKLDDFQPCQNWCCSPIDNYGLENFHRRHERNDPHKYGSSPMLMDQRGSHPDIYAEMNRCRRDMVGCCSYHMVPPPCYFYGDRGYRWTPPPYSKPSEQDEKLRKLQFDKDNLQLQVQVLTDQIEAQSYKISDLEKTLQDKKHFLVETEEKLQREVLSRSSLETQKLELMSIISDLKLQQAAMERENMELRNSHFNNNGDLKKSTLMSRATTSTPIQHSSSNQTISLRVSPSPSPVNILNSTRRSDSNYTLQDSQPPKTPPANYERQIDIHYASLPRQQFLSNGGNGIAAVDFNANPSANGGKKAVVFAQAEKGTTDESSDCSQVQFNKTKGIKKIFGKIKRSGSGNLEDIPGAGEFQRGGVRATAAARLGWSEPHLTQRPDKPFAEWNTENICDWLQDLGLDQYIPEAKKWVKNGQQLQECAIAELEKELNIKNPLHKKKLQLALIDVEENGSSDPFLKKAGELDTAWVLRWLDDIGLPQHKESFLMNRVDGRVLHRLTIDDLGILHVSSLLHVASIKRGIQVLRENNYDAACLKRRSVPNEEPATPKQVSLWTTHRVMEWLRAVDLSEYAPNLRGAGVHGGLMVYEIKFTAELFASLLSIPAGKTLLRRHLSTHFKELVSREIIQKKREAESTLGYVPLTPTAKLKITKKSQFSLKRKKSKGEADYGDLVCPLNPEKQSGEMNGSTLNNSMGMMRKNLEEEAVYHLVEKGAKSLPASVTNSPISFRNLK